MNLVLNGQPLDSPAPNLIALLHEIGVDTEQRGIAVAVNAAVVIRSEWERRELCEGDDIEVITAMQGG